MEDRTGRECGNRTATPPLPKAPHPCPSRPANGGTGSCRTGSGKVMAPTSGNPKVRKKEPTSYYPESAYSLRNERLKKSAYNAVCRSVRHSQEEEERPLPLARDLDMARLEEIKDDCCTWDKTTPSISSSKRRVSNPGDTVRERR